VDKIKFRLGSTSYVYPDNILPNVRQIGPFVDDVELVLFEVEDFSNLPNSEQIGELRQLAVQHDLTYTVHLPLDLRAVVGDPSLALARKVIALTRPLDPFAYVAHLNAREPMEHANWSVWREGCMQGLEEMAEATGDMARICIENLERWPHEEMYPILERIPVSFCLDIGHLWLQALDATAVIQRLAARTRVVHLHGIAERDHKSLAHVPAAQLRAALDALDQADYRGVVTLEVFSSEDFFPSRDLVLEWMATR
jgi:sugar phosphate isomerase/epimerase